jgi:hypothetical protein
MEAGNTLIQTKTLTEATAAFINAWPAGFVESSLWKVFRYASVGGLENEKGACSPERVAAFFDDLTVLAGVLQAAHPELLNNMPVRQTEEGAPYA